MIVQTIGRHSALWILGLCLAASAVRAADVDGDGVLDGVDECCNTPLGVTVDAVGRPVGDLNGDCDVDLADFATLQANFTGPMACTAEVCDGLDNDCDCVVDDFPPLVCGVGACEVTVPACTNGVPQTCTPGNPQFEACNGIDDDCDGTVDDGFGTVSCGTGICYNVVQECVNGVPQNCTPNPSAPEVCNGLDDNCDGIVDNPAPEVCNGVDDDCDGIIDNPAPEVCNGVDDDCDGIVDNPAPEVCNGVDDDCDGIVDNAMNLPYDPYNCGACGNVCPAAPNADPVCNNSVCGLSCDSGYGNCNASNADGCEIYLPADPGNCGACGIYCPPEPNATSTCQNSQCALICDAGYQDCNSAFGDGCEINITNDVQNCGACGLVCPIQPNASAACLNSQCSMVCDAGYADCNSNPNDGCEINLLSDNQNCGACGDACGIELVCVNGGCTAP